MKENTEAKFQGGGRGSTTPEQKGVTWLECSTSGRMPSIRLWRGVSSQEAFWVRARSWILFHEYQETISVLFRKRIKESNIEYLIL